MHRLTTHTSAPVRQKQRVFIDRCNAFSDCKILIYSLGTGIIYINNALLAALAEHSYMINSNVRQIQPYDLGYTQAAI